MEEVLRGDFDPTRTVNFDELLLFADSFGLDNPHYDLDRDGVVDLDDFFISADNFDLTAAQVKASTRPLPWPRRHRLDEFSLRHCVVIALCLQTLGTATLQLHALISHFIAGPQIIPEQQQIAPEVRATQTI